MNDFGMTLLYRACKHLDRTASSDGRTETDSSQIRGISDEDIEIRRLRRASRHDCK
jgi:hypothetical protein